jgi:ABC-type multidrug transport system fused ATPase/permease subunit
MAATTSPAAAARPPPGPSTSSTPIEGSSATRVEGSSAWSLVAWLPSTTRGISDVVSGSTALQEKRMRVMQLHIEELMRQTERRENELQKTQVLLKEHAKQRAVQQPQERKLFARLEQLQAELKTARELRSKAEAHSTDLQQQLEQVVMAAESESDKPDQQQLVRVTTQQLDATNTLLQQARLTPALTVTLTPTLALALALTLTPTLTLTLTLALTRRSCRWSSPTCACSSLRVKRRARRRGSARRSRSRMS